MADLHDIDDDIRALLRKLKIAEERGGGSGDSNEAGSDSDSDSDSDTSKKPKKKSVAPAEDKLKKKLDNLEQIAKGAIKTYTEWKDKNPRTSLKEGEKGHIRAYNASAYLKALFNMIKKKDVIIPRGIQKNQSDTLSFVESLKDNKNADVKNRLRKLADAIKQLKL